MEYFLAFLVLCAAIIVPFWIYTETPKGKKWIENL